MKVKPKRLQQIEFKVKDTKKRPTLNLEGLKNKYDIGMEVNENKKPTPKEVVSDYDRFLIKYLAFTQDDIDDGIKKFKTRDLAFYFKYQKDIKDIKYVIANYSKEYKTYNNLITKGYTVGEIYLMITFLFESGQTYLDLKSLSPYILSSGWSNKIYTDSLLFAKGEYSEKQNKKVVRTVEIQATKDSSTNIIGDW
ncbi:MAG: hypothetical protein R3Y64_11595 [Peptostreptococcaceae bacterium]